MGSEFSSLACVCDPWAVWVAVLGVRTALLWPGSGEPTGFSCGRAVCTGATGLVTVTVTVKVTSPQGQAAPSSSWGGPSPRAPCTPAPRSSQEPPWVPSLSVLRLWSPSPEEVGQGHSRGAGRGLSGWACASHTHRLTLQGPGQLGGGQCRPLPAPHAGETGIGCPTLGRARNGSKVARGRRGPAAAPAPHSSQGLPGAQGGVTEVGLPRPTPVAREGPVRPLTPDSPP